MGQPAPLRLKNRLPILSALFEYAQLTRPQIAQLFGVSTATANSIIRDLLGQGLVKVFGPSHGPLERVSPARPVILSLSARAGQFMGLDVQRRQLHVVTGKLTGGDVAEECIRLADGDDLTGRELPVLEQHREVGRWGIPKSVMLSLFAPVEPGGVPGEPGALPDSDLPRVAAWGQASRVLMASRMSVAKTSGAGMAAAHARNALLVQGRDIPEAM